MATEKRLIDANKLEENIIETAEGLADCDQQNASWALRKYAVREINDAPTVDAVEVVHGWWIELPSMEPDYKCSECGRTYAWWEPSEAHFCPNCGAKMDGDGNG